MRSPTNVVQYSDSLKFSALTCTDNHPVLPNSSVKTNSEGYVVNMVKEYEEDISVENSHNSSLYRLQNSADIARLGYRCLPGS